MLIDIFFAIIFLFSAIRGIFRGFAHQAISLIFLIVGYIFAKQYGAYFVTVPEGAQWYSTYLAVSTVVVFFLVVLFGAGINYIVAKSLAETKLSGVNRVLGLGFGFLRGLLFLMIIVYVLQLTTFTQSVYWQSSKIGPMVEQAVNTTMGYLS